jgi:DNA-binding protein H-NS
MTTLDLSGYNLNGLKGLQHDVEKEIKNRQQQEVKNAREQILSIAQSLGLSVDELLASTARKAQPESIKKVQPQYKNPADSSQMWSGRGRQPRWLADELASGKKLADFRIG